MIKKVFLFLLLCIVSFSTLQAQSYLLKEMDEVPVDVIKESIQKYDFPYGRNPYAFQRYQDSFIEDSDGLTLWNTDFNTGKTYSFDLLKKEMKVFGNGHGRGPGEISDYILPICVTKDYMYLSDQDQLKFIKFDRKTTKFVEKNNDYGLTWIKVVDDKLVGGNNIYPKFGKYLEYTTDLEFIAEYGIGIEDKYEGFQTHGIPDLRTPKRHFSRLYPVYFDFEGKSDYTITPYANFYYELPHEDMEYDKFDTGGTSYTNHKTVYFQQVYNDGEHIGICTINRGTTELFFHLYDKKMNYLCSIDLFNNFFREIAKTMGLEEDDEFVASEFFNTRYIYLLGNDYKDIYVFDMVKAAKAYLKSK